MDGRTDRAKPVYPPLLGCGGITKVLFDVNVLKKKNDKLFRSALIPFQKKPWILRVCSSSLWKHCEEKEKLLVTSNFSFSPQCFLPIWITFGYFHQIWNCCLQILSVWKSLNFVVWERVNLILLETWKRPFLLREQRRSLETSTVAWTEYELKFWSIWIPRKNQLWATLCEKGVLCICRNFRPRSACPVITGWHRPKLYANFKFSACWQIVSSTWFNSVKTDCMNFLLTLCHRVLIDWLIVYCLTSFSTVFQLYCSGQCTYPWFPQVLLTSALHNILSKPLAAFPHNHCPKNRQRWTRNESWLPAFPPFPTTFSTIPKTNFMFSVTFILSSAKLMLSIWTSLKICRSVKS